MVSGYLDGRAGLFDMLVLSCGKQRISFIQKVRFLRNTSNGFISRSEKETWES